MNNIWSFSQYKENTKYIETQIIRESILNEKLNMKPKEKLRKHKASGFVSRVLHDEIKLGEEFETRIKKTIAEIQESCKKLSVKSNKGSALTRKINEIITDINGVSFDALTLLGGSGKIDFHGFHTSVVLATAIQFIVLFRPLLASIIIKKAYDYFIGIVRQTIRKDLVMLVVNFDQFQNLILQKTIESAENASYEDLSRLEAELGVDYEDAIRAVLKGKKKEVDQIIKLREQKRKERQDYKKYDASYTSLMNSYDNTYKQTAETLKQYISDDDNKRLEAIKNSILKFGHGDEDMQAYGELLISLAEEKALKTTNAIHNNFLKMSEVFKLSNQKNLIDLITEAEKEEMLRNKKEKKIAKEKFNYEKNLNKVEFLKDEFGKIKEEYDLKNITSEELEKLKDEEVVFDYEGKEEKMSKYDVLTNQLKEEDAANYSDDLKMLMVVDTDSDIYNETYYSYLVDLGDSINKSLVMESDGNCYLDLCVLDSVDEIMGLLDKYVYKGDRSDRVKRLKYINDNIIKFDYSRLLDKFEELGDIVKGLDNKELKEKIESVWDKINISKSDFESDGTVKIDYDEAVARSLYFELNSCEKQKDDAEKEIDEYESDKSKDKGSYPVHCKSVIKGCTNRIKKIRNMIDDNKVLKKFFDEDYELKGYDREDIEDDMKKHSGDDVMRFYLRVRINHDRYSEWKKKFNEFKNYLENGDTEDEEKTSKK